VPEKEALDRRTHAGGTCRNKGKSERGFALQGPRRETPGGGVQRKRYPDPSISDRFTILAGGDRLARTGTDVRMR